MPCTDLPCVSAIQVMVRRFTMSECLHRVCLNLLLQRGKYYMHTDT